MTKIVLIIVVVLAFASAFLIHRANVADDSFTSVADKQNAANEPLVRTEYETQGDETRPSGAAIDVQELSSGNMPSEEDAVVAQEAVPVDENQLLTVEGYDANQVRLLLVETEMPAERREEYLTRLEQAYGDESAMADVLSELRTELNSG